MLFLPLISYFYFTWFDRGDSSDELIADISFDSLSLSAKRCHYF
ncbi:Uncharacterized protein dnm_083250 [Desulfonema magnum]|uniref:Uncharacterized protein n=1 Tax=Desulfonema magnum TaxID=45655 RepID=A0A975GSP0_9BACT|nr:Uncharacterized protein dnm_083250 [Desulfonema magnum]